MTLLDLKTSTTNNDVNIYFNGIFKNEIEDGILLLLNIKSFASTNEYGWLNKANENVLATLMSWKK